MKKKMRINYNSFCNQIHFDYFEVVNQHTSQLYLEIGLHPIITNLL